MITIRSYFQELIEKEGIKKQEPTRHRRCKFLQWQIYSMTPKWKRKMRQRLKFNYDMKISLHLDIKEAIIKHLSKEVTVMTMEN